jgi:intracellular multiplication protein IcmL
MADQKIKRTSSGTEKTVSKPNMLLKVKIRNGFYWAQYQHLLVANVMAAILFVSGLGAFGYFVTFTPPHKYIPTTPDFKVLVSPPLSEEFLNEGDVVQAATNVLRGVYTYDFANWRDQLTSTQRWFTTDGWNGFTNELTRSGVVKTVEQNNQIVSSRILDAPFVKEKGVMNGRYTWIVEFPKVEISYRNQSTRAQNLSFVYGFKMEMTRAALDVSPKGVLVNAIRAKEVGAGQPQK